MVTETLIRLFGKCVLGVTFGVRANYTKIPMMNAISRFVVGGSCLPTASLLVKTGISIFLRMSIANNVSFGEMAYCLGVTVSRKTLNIWGSIVSDGLCFGHSAAKAY